MALSIQPQPQRLQHSTLKTGSPCTLIVLAQWHCLTVVCLCQQNAALNEDSFFCRYSRNARQLNPAFLHYRYWGADKSLARPGRKQARKHVRDVRDFNNIETRAFIKFLFLQGKAPKEIHAILTETLACLLPGRAKDLSALLYNPSSQIGFCKPGGIIRSIS